MTAQAFTVTHTEYDLEVDYMFRRIGRSRMTVRGAARRLLWTAFGVAMLFTAYTFILGVLLLLVMASIWTFALWGGVLQRASFQAAPRSPRTYEVTERGFGVRAEGKESSAQWSQLSSWEEDQGILRLNARDMPSVYIPVDRLQREGLYDRVVSLASAHGKRFVTAGA